MRAHVFLQLWENAEVRGRGEGLDGKCRKALCQGSETAFQSAGCADVITDVLGVQ